jgi:hypothetical protein
MPQALGRLRRHSRLGNVMTRLGKAFKGLFDPYRPELHYMRGPGPKWHEKHDNSGPTGR